MAKWVFIFLVAMLVATQAAARVLPGANNLNDEKNVVSFGGVGGYSGLGPDGIPFGGVGAGVGAGAGGNIGGATGFSGIGGGIGTLPGVGGAGGLGGGYGGGAGGLPHP